MDNLGYEQLLALKIMRDTPDMKGSEIAKKADCSWDELFSMSEMGLIELGMNRINKHQTHPIITPEGLKVLSKAESEKTI